MKRNSFMDATSPKDERFETLKQLYPELIRDNKLNLEALKDLLDEESFDEGEVGYSLYWPGKRNAKKLARKEAEGTLEPIPGDGVNEDKTNNIYIEGDNLEVLRCLKKSYGGRVKMIYIDPPYNTGKDFIYPDNFAEPIEDYLKFTGQVDEKGVSLVANPKSSGAYHRKWLDMMLPRLQLARELLTNDGVIFISIDDNEQANLKLLCDEVFGEENFRNILLVRRRIKSLNLQFADNGLNSYNVGCEYVLVYSKSESFLFNPIRVKKQNFKGKGSWNVFWSNADRPSMRYNILGFTPSEGQWRWQRNLAEEAVENYMVYERDFSSKMTLEEYWHETGENKRFVRRITDGKGKNGGVQYWVAPDETSLRTSNWCDLEVSQIAKDYELPFDNPKNVDLIKTILSTIKGNDFICLDFFSGSSTTADAVFRLNANDSGNRKFVMVQLPIDCSESSENSNFKTICEIGKERIRRAGKKILEEHPELKDKLDVGFRVYRLAQSNIEAYKPTTGSDQQSLLNALEAMEKQVTPLRDGFDLKNSNDIQKLLTEIMLRQGFALDSHVEKTSSLAKNSVYRITDEAHPIVLHVCLDSEIKPETVKSICFEENDKFVCLNSAISDELYAQLSDKGRVETI